MKLEVTMTNAGEAHAFWDVFFATIPGRAKGRKNMHRELFKLGFFFRVLLNHGKLGFPHTAIKSERPDFDIDDPKLGRFGLEMSEATTRREQRKFESGEKNTKPKLIRKEGWHGDAPERECAGSILHRTHAKRRSIAKYPLQPSRPQQVDLLLYLNKDAAFVVHERDLLKIVRAEYRPKSFGRIHRVHVIVGSKLLWDVFGSGEILPAKQ